MSDNVEEHSILESIWTIKEEAVKTGKKVTSQPINGQDTTSNHTKFLF